MTHPGCDPEAHLDKRLLNVQVSLTFYQYRLCFFLTFHACFKNPIIFSNLNSNWSNLLDLRNLQEEVKKSILLPEIVLTSDLSLFE